MSRSARLIGRRLLVLPLSLFVVVSLSFGLVELMPGDPAVTVAGPLSTEEQLEDIRRELGLDLPLGERYAAYVGGLLRGDLGTSFYSKRPITEELLRRLPNTIELSVLALLTAALLGLLLGTVGAYFRMRLPDKLVGGAITVAQSIPDFLLALLLIYTVFFLWHLAPAPVGRLGLLDVRPPRLTGFLLLDAALTGYWATFWRVLHHLLLPVLTLGLVYSAYLAKTARSTLSAALGSPQVEFARACGLPERQVLRYAFLTARTPILTYGAILFGVLIGGAAVIETIFSWDGVGEWALESILLLDIPAIQGFILAAGLATLLIYLALDVLVLLLDPRVTYG